MLLRLFYLVRPRFKMLHLSLDSSVLPGQINIVADISAYASVCFALSHTPLLSIGQLSLLLVIR